MKRRTEWRAAEVGGEGRAERREKREGGSWRELEMEIEMEIEALPTRGGVVIDICSEIRIRRHVSPAVSCPAWRCGRP
jgi:hypothetical protein